LWRNAILFELPRGDYAQSLVRRYLADLAEAVRCDALAQSPLAPLAETAARVRQEEKYHLVHGATMLEHLAASSDDARARLQAALDWAFPYALGIWEAPEGEEKLVAGGALPASSELGSVWLDLVTRNLARIGLVTPAAEPVLGGRRGVHGEGLQEILDAMQRLHRLEPGAVW
jgi:ring-1,2-phenylacetyl-CoA epoxidase subunit PaaC